MMSKEFCSMFWGLYDTWNELAERYDKGEEKLKDLMQKARNAMLSHRAECDVCNERAEKQAAK